MSTFKSGDELTGASLNKVADDASQAKQPRLGKGLVGSSGPSGTSLSRTESVENSRLSTIKALARNNGTLPSAVYEAGIVTTQYWDRTNPRIHTQPVLVVNPIDEGNYEKAQYALVVWDGVVGVGMLGRVFLAGVCLVYIEGDETEGEFVTATKEGKLEASKQAGGACARLIWQDLDNAPLPRLALIRFPLGGSGDVVEFETWDDVPEPAEHSVGTIGYVKSSGWFLIVTAPEAYGGDSETDDPTWESLTFVWKFPCGGDWPGDD